MEEHEYVNLLLVEGPTEDYMAVCPYEIDVHEGDVVELAAGAAVRGIVLEKLAAHRNGAVLKMIRRMVGEPEGVAAVYRKTWEDDHNEDQDCD